MKSLYTYITENEKWYSKYLDVFNQEGEPYNILMGSRTINTNHIDKEQNIIVTKIGSDKSDVFGINYYNKAGIEMLYSFSLPNENRKLMMASTVDTKNSYIPELIEKNKDKLPILKRDSMGNIRI